MNLQEKLNKVHNLEVRKNQIDSFIFYARERGFWERIAVKRQVRLFSSVNGFDSKGNSLKLDKKLTLEVIKILEAESQKLHDEMEALFGKNNENES